VVTASRFEASIEVKLGVAYSFELDTCGEEVVVKQAYLLLIMVDVVEKDLRFGLHARTRIARQHKQIRTAPLSLLELNWIAWSKAIRKNTHSLNFV